MTGNQNELIDRAAAYGDGLFETIAIRGGKPRLWSIHFERLQTGCARLGLACPPENSLLANLESAIAAAGVEISFASARLTVSAGPSARGYSREPNANPIIQVSLHRANPLAATIYQSGIAARLCTTRLGVQPLLAGIKTLNRLEQVLARAEWTDAQVFEGFMLDTDGRLICGTMSNVFIVKESALITPAITRCGVSGVMRRHLINLLAKEQSGACEVRDVAAEELAVADEVFVTNSQLGVVPVQACNSLRWEIGPVTRHVQAIAARNGVPECSP